MNASVPHIKLDPNGRDRIAAIADILMPGGDGLPLPSEIDIQGYWIDEALVAAPALAGSLGFVLQANASPPDIIDDLRANEPEVFMALTFLLSGAYFMHPTVRKALGYEGQAIPENPPLEGEAEYYLEDGLLEPVIARGRIHRPTPDELTETTRDGQPSPEQR